MSDASSRKILTTREAGELLHVSDDTIKRYVQKGDLEGFTLPGGYYRIFADSVEKMMTSAQ